MKALLIALTLLLPTSVFGQQRDSVFASYDAYSSYVDKMIMGREFESLIMDLGGRDEYTKEQLGAVNNQLLGAFPSDFEHSTIFREENMGGGMHQEARAFWTGESYAFFYAVIHIRENDVVVLNFNLNSSVATIMSKF